MEQIKELTKRLIANSFKELMMQVKQYEKLTAKAALTGDRQALYAAAAAHPLIGDSEQARACLEEMLEANKAYLPQFFKT